MKKTSNKIISILLSVLMLMAFLPTIAFAETSGDYTYSLDSNGNAIINSFSNNSVSDIVIPGEFDGHPVTSIGWSAFKNFISLKSVIIPDSVKSIGFCAFENCASLTSITIPDSVTEIGDSVFNKCTSMKNIIIPDSVTSIGSGVFFDCTSLESVIIPNGVKIINEHLFNSCKSLTEVTIPDSVTEIGYNAFAFCDSLKSVTIPNSVTTIKFNAFEDCKSLTSVTLPDSLTSIENYAFRNCLSLTNITIPDSVTSIGVGVFSLCNSLTNIEVDEKNSTFCSQDGVLYDISKTKIFKYPAKKSGSSYVIPDSVITIAGGAFAYCKSLTSISIPVSVTEIGDSAFLECNNISGVYYSGTEEQWNNIHIGILNGDLTSVAIHFNCSLNEHSWSSWTVTTPATALNSGTETRICSVCGETETRDIPKLETPTEEPTTKPSYMLGDVNSDGKVNAADARLALRISADLDVATEIQNLAADVDGNKKITASDARTILRVSADLEKF